MKTVVVGSRESVLAVVQARMLIERLSAAHPELNIELVTMKTTGDRILDRTLDKVGGKGLFVKELDTALREHRADITVHSLKDMPMETPEDLPLLCFSAREDPRDALVLPEGVTELAPGAVIGSSSLRRALQLKELYPDNPIEPVRGNLQTRLRKLDEGQYGALVLAAAGLKRLGLGGRISRVFTPDEIIPAAGQGILGVQGRCTSPVCAHAELRGDTIFLRALYYDSATGAHRVGTDEGSTDDPETLGIRLARRLRG